MATSVLGNVDIPLSSSSCTGSYRGRSTLASNLLKISARWRFDYILTGLNICHNVSSIFPNRFKNDIFVGNKNSKNSWEIKELFVVWNLGPKGFQFSSISGYLLKNSSGLDQSFKKVSKNSQKNVLKKMAKNSLKKNH